MASTPQSDFLIFLLIFLGLFGLWVASDGPQVVSSDKENNSLISRVSFDPEASDAEISAWDKTRDTDTTNFSDSDINSPWAGYVTIEAGSAASTNQPSDEYIIIQASYDLKEPITITNWLIQNGGFFRLYDQNGKVVVGNTRTVKIPAGVYRYTNSSSDVFTPIVLGPGEQAIVTTGSPRRVTTQFKFLGSFKTNKCTGYIDQLSNYDFEPSLPRNCPDPRNEVGIMGVSDDCRDFIDQNIYQCHTPKFTEYQTIDGERDRGNFVDGFDGLSNVCRDYIKRHFNFEGCMQFYANDPDFYDESQWRIYLGQTWEMWASRNEVISLYDAQGRLVDQIKY